MCHLKSTAAVHQPEPVGVGMTIRIGSVAELLDVFGRIQRSHTLVGACLVGELGILSRIDILGAVGSPLPAKGGGIVDLRLAFLTALRCDDDDTVGSFGAIDGSRSSIFQHGDRLDVVGVKVVHRALHAIDDDHRGGIVECSGTTDTDGVVAIVHTRTTGVVLNLYTRHLAFNAHGNGGKRTVAEILCTDRRDTAGEIGFLLGAKTYYHHLIQ